jgi:acylglycerol lipase
VTESPFSPTELSSSFRAADGVRLHALAWPAGAPRARVLLSHGLGEHAGRYRALARDLVPAGFSLHALDHRGHGRSGGVRGYARRFSSLVDDFEAFRRRVVAEANSDLPMFVVGHSLGGLIVLRWLERVGGEGLAGAVLSAPLLAIAKQAARWKLALAGTLSRLAPWLPLGNEVDPAELTSDPAYLQAYRDDPLVHSRITPRLYTEMMAAMGDAVAEAQRITLPTLFIVPGADTIVREQATLDFAASLPCEVTVRRFPGFHHESLNELGRERPVGELLAWLEAHLPRPRKRAGPPG